MVLLLLLLQRFLSAAAAIVILRNCAAAANLSPRNEFLGYKKRKSNEWTILRLVYIQFLRYMNPE
jgi:hypothetical protein